MVVLGTLLLGGGVQAWLNYRQALQLTHGLQQNEARVVSARVEAFFSNINNSLISIARMPWGVGEMNASARVDEFESLFRVAPAVSDIVWQDNRGGQHVFLSRTQPNKFNGNSRKQMDLQVKHFSTTPTIVTDPFLRDGLDFNVIIAIDDFYNDGGTTFATVNLRFISALVESIKVGETGVAYIVDASGHIIAHPNIALAMQQGRAFEQQLNQTDSVSIAREGSIGSDGVRKKINTISSSVPIAGTNWRVVVEQDSSEVLKAVISAVLQTTALLGAVLIFALMSGRVLSNRIVKPIETLDKEVKRFAQGDLSARASAVSQDEIGKLADSFNSMAAQLQDYTQTLEQKVADKTRQLEAANQHKSDFLANMSHELRTPLNAVIGFSDALKEEYFGPLNDKQKEYVQDISGSGQHLLSLINDILDLSKIEAGKMELECSRFDIAAAIDTAMVLVRERALRDGIRLQADLAPNLGEMWGDERKIKQVLINLLTNAVKFSHPNGWVIVVARRDINIPSGSASVNSVTISVADAGVGIAAEDQADIFAEFYQVKRGVGAGGAEGGANGPTKQEGTGLGLSLAQRFVQLHGGTIWVESALGKGAKFTFNLPDIDGIGRLKTP